MGVSGGRGGDGRASVSGCGPSCLLEVVGGSGRCRGGRGGGLMFVVVTVVGERERSGKEVVVVVVGLVVVGVVVEC